MPAEDVADPDAHGAGDEADARADEDALVDDAGRVEGLEAYRRDARLDGGEDEGVAVGARGEGRYGDARGEEALGDEPDVDGDEGGEDLGARDARVEEA